MKEKIKQILKETIEVQQVDDNISRMESSEWDSLKHLILISNLESEFNVSIEPEDIAKLNTLTDIENTLKQLLNS